MSTSGWSMYFRFMKVIAAGGATQVIGELGLEIKYMNAGRLMTPAGVLKIRGEGGRVRIPEITYVDDNTDFTIGSFATLRSPTYITGLPPEFCSSSNK